MLEKAPVWFRRSLWALMILAVALRLFYWGYTHRTWEDALIAVLHSQNAARGLGLTHAVPPGEGPVQGFTSPLGVLVPLLGELVHPGYGLGFIKALSALVSSVAVLLAALLSLEIGLPYVLALVPAAFVALEEHQILWGMSGMETELTTTLYLFSLYALLRGSQWMKGVSLGLLLLARPDAGLWVTAFLLIECWRAWRLRAPRRLLPLVGWLVLLYGPWLAFATAYYGTPVPNTIVAKELGYPSVLQLLHGHPPRDRFNYMKLKLYSVFGSFEPSYDGLGTGFLPFFAGRTICWVMLALLALGTYVAIRDRTRALYVFLLVWILGLYLWIPTPVVFGWYTPPVVAVAVIGSCYGGWCLAQRSRRLQRKELVVGWVGLGYILLLAAVLPITFRSDKYVQADIESNRRNVGEFINRNSTPGDTVATECLGYVGYYSRRLTYDFPGLCSRRVVEYMRHAPPAQRNLISMASHLQPTYLVLRPLDLESAAGQAIAPWLSQNYEMVRRFDVTPDAASEIRGYPTSIDQTFFVYRRRSPGAKPVD